MKKALLQVLFLFGCTTAFAQGYYSFEAGLGNVTPYASYYTPAFNAGYMKMLFKHVFIGGSISEQDFSFGFSDSFQQYTDPNYGSITNVNHHSAYLFFCPSIDISFGENRYFHLFCNGGPGFYLYGNELTTYLTHSNIGRRDYNYINTSGNNSRLVYQYGFGVSEYIPTNWYWSIKLSQQYCILGRDLNDVSGNAPLFRSNYYSFTIGISHYYGKLYYY